MGHSLKSSLYKFLGYCLALSALLVSYIVVIEMSPISTIAENNLFKYTRIDNKAPKVLFIGSSRVQCSVNPGILKAQLPEYDFYNLGMANSSVLYNCQLAHKLIPSLPQKSIIFIELSDLSILPPANFFYFNSYADLYNLTKQKFSLNFELNDIEKIGMSMVDIRAHIKLATYPQASLFKEVGFLKRNGLFKGNTGAFVNEQEINQSGDALTPSQKNCLSILGNLVENARKRQIKIVFMPSLTIRKASERKYVLPIFNKIRPSDKWTYSDNFLGKIADTKYLYDLNHLNEQGAELYSLEVVNEIKRVKN